MFKKLIMVLALLVGFTSPSILLGSTANAEEVSPEVHLDSDGVMRNFDPSTISETDIVSESPMVGLNENGETVIVPEENPMLRNALKKILLGDYVLSGQQTQEWAKAMKKLQSGTILDYLNTSMSIIMGIGTPGGIGTVAYQFAAIGSKNRAVKSTVIAAAAQGKRVRILLYDEKPHTSYSVTVKILAVN